MKPMNWISATGRSPVSAMPNAVPTIADSASGVSNTRCGPKRSCRPSVARKTPPSLPTSWPITSTRSSAPSACSRARLMAWSITTSAIRKVSLSLWERAGPAPWSAAERGPAPWSAAERGPAPWSAAERGPAPWSAAERGPAPWSAAERGVRVPYRPARRKTVSGSRGHLDVLAQRGHRHRLGLLDGVIYARKRLANRLALGVLVPQLALFEVAPHPRQRIASAPLVDLLRRLVATWIVRRGMRADSVGKRFHQRRSITSTGSFDRPVAGRVHRQCVVAVDQHAGDPLRQPLLGQRLARRLTRARHADGPVVVLHKQHGLRIEHAGEVERFQEVALRRGPVAYNPDRDVPLLLEREAHARADGV